MGLLGGAEPRVSKAKLRDAANERMSKLVVG